MNELKINNINMSSVVNAPADAVEIKANVENTSKDTQESTKEAQQKSGAKTNNKHVITYIGGSEYIDMTGRKWHKHDEQTYSDSEYVTRKDLHFMVKYGEMKHTVVAM